MLGKLLKRELKSYRLQVGITFLVAAIITVFMKVISMLPMKDPDGKIFLQMFTYMGVYISDRFSWCCVTDLCDYEVL